MLKAAFIGAGGRSRKAHYPTIHRLNEEVEMAAVCELDGELMDRIVQEHQFRHTFTDHREMLDAIDPDIVYCVMNEKWLLKPALDCLNAGKHLFIEKPPGKNSIETQRILDAAVANDVYCMVGFQRRFAAITREAMRVVGEKGPVSLVATTFHKQILGLSEPELTTTLWNDVIHIVDLTRYLAGGEPIEVTAYQDKFGSQDYNHYTALVRFDNDVTGVILGNRASGGRVLRAEIHGVGIGCYMDLPRGIKILEDHKARTLSAWEINGVPKQDALSYGGVVPMHRHFLECIRNRKVPNSDIRDVIHTVHLVDRIEAVDRRP